MATEGNLRFVGVFHFGNRDKSCPIRSLETELERWEHGVENSLLVLPEGFNVPGGYYDGPGPAASTRRKLLALSEKYQVAFVTGLIEERPARGYPKGFNSAYLVDASSDEQFTLLSQKRRDYDERICSSNPDGFRRAVVYKGVGVAALICTDFTECEEDDRTTLVEHSGWAGRPIKVLCVPAYSTHRGLLIGRSAAWKGGICIAAANGTFEDNSFVSTGSQVAKLAPGEWNGIPGDAYYGCPYDRVLTSELQT